MDQNEEIAGYEAYIANLLESIREDIIWKNRVKDTIRKLYEDIVLGDY